MNQQICLLLAGGTVMGCLFRYLHIPGGCMLGAVVGSMAVKLLGSGSETMPQMFYLAAQIAIGTCVGAMFSLETLSALKGQIPVMILSTAVLLLAGLLAAAVVRHMTDMDIISSILSTSPGGLNAVIGMADNGTHTPQIMAFQMVRLYAILLLVPAFCWILKIFFHK